MQWPRGFGMDGVAERRLENSKEMRDISRRGAGGYVFFSWEFGLCGCCLPSSTAFSKTFDGSGDAVYDGCGRAVCEEVDQALVLVTPGLSLGGGAFVGGE